MRIPKSGKLLAGAVVILLSVLIVTQIGGFCHAQTSAADDDEDKFLAGLDLFLKGDFERAYGKFNVAYMFAMMFEDDSVKAMKAQKYMGDCADTYPQTAGMKGILRILRFPIPASLRSISNQTDYRFHRAVKLRYAFHGFPKP